MMGVVQMRVRVEVEALVMVEIGTDEPRVIGLEIERCDLLSLIPAPLRVVRSAHEPIAGIAR